MKDLKCIICGMNLDEKNYNFNSSGILNKNHNDIFTSCPFCGAGSSYLLSEGNTIFNYIKGVDSVTRRILDHAMKLEVFNGEFYKEASTLAADESVKEMFNALSRIELMHARIHQRLGGFDKLPVLQKIDYSRLKSDTELLQLAQKREEHAVAYYSKYIVQVSDNRIKTVFSALSEVEKEHIELTT